MDTAQAIEVLQALADGIDPVTGEVFAEDSPYQRPQIIRALFCALRSLEHAQQVIKRPTPRIERNAPNNAGKAWSSEEDALLCHRFDGGTAIENIALMHGRTRGSITSRLARLGKIETRDIIAVAAEVNRAV